jgi:DNA-binding NarL/FixJ family response regulator
MDTPMSSDIPAAAMRLVIADDHAVFAEALAIALAGTADFPVRITGLAANGEHLLGLLKEVEADLVLLDLNMPVMSGLEALPVLRQGFPDLAIIVLTQYRDPKIVRECIQEHGVNGFVLKSSSLDELTEAIRLVSQGMSYMSRDLQLYPREEREDVHTDPAFDEGFVSRYNLTRRETEILSLIAQAKGNAEIAERLYISRQTVLAHRKNIMRKLNIATTPALVRFAIQHQANGG